MNALVADFNSDGINDLYFTDMGRDSKILGRMIPFTCLNPMAHGKKLV